MAKKEAATAPALTADLLALIKERDDILQWLKPAQDREMEIRRQIAATFFPNATEGANRLFTEDGYELYLNHKINRKIDEATIDTLMLQLPEDAPARVPGVLITYKPSLVISGYRALPEDQLKIIQQAITETPGSPELDVRKTALPITDAMSAQMQGTSTKAEAIAAGKAVLHGKPAKKAATKKPAKKGKR